MKFNAGELEPREKRLEIENAKLKKSLKSFQKEWQNERDTKTKLLESLKDNKEFYLPPCYFVESKQLDQVKTQTSVGSGNFGTVELRMFRGKTVAVKFLINSNYSGEQQRNMILREAKVMVNLRNHNGLPTLIGICTDEAPYKLILDFFCI